MIGYVLFGTKDLKKAATLYDDLAAAIGGERKMELENNITWGGPQGVWIGVTDKTANGEPPSVGNGVMAGINVGDTATVDKLHKIAMDHGCQDEGGPGERRPGFYAAYFRDLDGNKLCAVHISH